MAVDLGDLVDSLKREVSPPGEDLFPNAVEDDYIGNLEDAFWDAMLDGLIDPARYTEADASVTPIAPNTTELSREYQQLVVFYAGIRIIRNFMLNMNSTFRAKAGPVEFETVRSATVVRDLLAELVRKRNIILLRLSDIGTSQSYYVDAILARDEAMAFGDTPYVGHTIRRIEGGYGRTY